MREQITVSYELNIICDGGEFTEEFSHVYDSDIYNSDIEGTDLMMINFKMNELKEKYGDDLLLLDFSVSREGVVH